MSSGPGIRRRRDRKAQRDARSPAASTAPPCACPWRRRARASTTRSRWWISTRRQEGDAVADCDGIPLFVDPASAAPSRGCHAAVRRQPLRRRLPLRQSEPAARCWPIRWRAGCRPSWTRRSTRRRGPRRARVALVNVEDRPRLHQVRRWLPGLRPGRRDPEGRGGGDPDAPGSRDPRGGGRHGSHGGREPLLLGSHGPGPVPPCGEGSG